MMRHWKLFIIICFLSIQSIHAAITYQVRFVGIKDKITQQEIKDHSELIRLQKRPPRSINALRYRTNADILEMQKALKANGYFDAKIVSNFEEIDTNHILITIDTLLGQRYTIKALYFFNEACDPKTDSPLYREINPKDVHLAIDSFLTYKNINRGRSAFLQFMSQQGYPFAVIKEQKILANRFDKTVTITFCISPGPLSHFGPLTIEGLSSLSPAFIDKKLLWKEGDTYSSELVEEMQRKLITSNLFSTVSITRGTNPEENDLPIKIDVQESKHKNISAGISYATYDGLGLDFGWANYNIGKLGETLILQGTVSQKDYRGIITYKKPYFLTDNQDYVLRFMAERDKVHSYLAKYYSLTSRIDRKISEKTLVSWGIRGKPVEIEKSAKNGKFILLELPIFLSHSTTDNLLNPTKGYFINYIPKFSVDLAHERNFFFKQTFTFAKYISLIKSDAFIFAYRVQFKSILSSSKSFIPINELCLGGSDEDLRGYRYKTVSPRDKQNRPLGGNSAIFISLEPRLRVSRTLGLVPFFDIGTVSEKQYPDVSHKWYKSTGIGFRYFTFFGPIRCDIGFPLNKRKHLDHKFELYISIGQAF